MSRSSVAEQLAAFPAETRDRAREHLNQRIDEEQPGEDLSAEAYDDELLSVCQELAAIDAANDRADRLARRA